MSAFPRVDRLWPHSREQSNAMTCDVEDYFQVSAFESRIERANWHQYECRIPRNVDRILTLFDDANVRCTFFTLAWVAERFPTIIRRMADAGHEIASHGMAHVRVYDQTAEQFAEDAGRSKAILEDVIGQAVRGYRAASWSMDERTPWAHNVLADLGYAYSSSIYPVSHDHYGLPSAPRVPFYTCDGQLLEIPACAARIAGRNLPSAGGGWFRLLPFAVSKALIRRYKQQTGVPAMFYFHPWELDPEQPRIEKVSRKARFRHYVNLDIFDSRLQVLLRAFQWGRMDEIFLR